MISLKVCGLNEFEIMTPELCSVELIKLLQMGNLQLYCKFGNFCEIFIFLNSNKRHICHFQNARPGHDLPTSENDRVISSFCEGFIFTKFCICKVSLKLNPRENFRIYSIYKSYSCMLGEHSDSVEDCLI